jgi:hypothetical protein
MNISPNGSSDNLLLNERSKTLFISKIFGKIGIYLFWVGLIVANVIAMIHIRES